MRTVLVGIKNNKAYELLKNLEDLKLIELLRKRLNTPQQTPKQALSKKYAGKLPADIAHRLQEHVKQSRSEWNRDI